jgi:hypothetical protein
MYSPIVQDIIQGTFGRQTLDGSWHNRHLLHSYAFNCLRKGKSQFGDAIRAIYDERYRKFLGCGQHTPFAIARLAARVENCIKW